MAERVVSLKEALGQMAEPMSKRNNRAVVVGHRVRRDLCDLAKSRVWRAGWLWIIAPSPRKRTEAKCVGIRIQYQPTNAMMAKLPKPDEGSAPSNCCQFKPHPWNFGE